MMLDLISGPRVQPLRLASGLVLFAFAVLHFTNHAAGLISLDAADAVQDWRLRLTHTTPVRLLLAAALITHVVLGLGKLAARRTLRLPALEWLQIASGLLIPAVLIPHVSAMVHLSTQTNYNYSYTTVTYLNWPHAAAWMAAALLAVWYHGCIGIYFWLRANPWFRRVRLLLLAAATALPLLALTGALSAARESHIRFSNPQVAAQAHIDRHWPDATTAAAVRASRDVSWAIYAGLLALVVVVMLVRHASRLRAPMLSVQYAGGPKVRGPRGSTLLEISRMRHVPHASVCGGRARCSTCRVRIDGGANTLPAIAPVEAATLARIAAPPNVRLACQLRPNDDLEVTRLVTPSRLAEARAVPDKTDATGVEKVVAVMFLDVRGFTRLAEHRLPFDVVFLLNQFFDTVGAVIRDNGGWIDKYMGDGLMAVFGRRSGIAAGSAQALAAARGIDLALDDLNRRLAGEVGDNIKIGIGIHAGPVVFGHIGDRGTARLTVVGHTVNEASRLEALTKDKVCQLIISRDVAAHAGIDFDDAEVEEVEVRGSAAKIGIIAITAARALPLKPRRSRPAASAT